MQENSIYFPVSWNCILNRNLVEIRSTVYSIALLLKTYREIKITFLTMVFYDNLFKITLARTN